MPRRSTCTTKLYPCKFKYANAIKSLRYESVLYQDFKLSISPIVRLIVGLRLRAEERMSYVPKNGGSMLDLAQMRETIPLVQLRYVTGASRIVN